MSPSKSAHRPVDSKETFPMTVDNITFMVDRLHRDCSPIQFLRELTQNSIEATRELPDRKGEIIWDVDWNRYDLTGVRKVAIIDTGIGMTGEEMVRYINSLSSSMRQQSVEGNYGVGAKIAAVPRNRAGLVYLSWKDGVGYMIHVWRDPETEVYGCRKFERPDGTAEYWAKVEDSIKPEQIKHHGTMVILLGNDMDEITIQAPPGTPMPSRWILRYLNSRYYQFPKGITVKAREGWELPKGDSHNFLRTVTGMKFWLDKNASDSGTLPLTKAKAHWWILNESLDLDSGHYVSGGHAAAHYQEELYELQTGRAGVSRLQAFGVIFGYQRVVIYVEPKGEDEQLTSNTSRTNLLLNDEPLPWVDWAAEFRESMPEPIKNLVEEVGARSAGHDHRASIRERLKQIMDLFKVSRYRPSPISNIEIEESGGGHGGVPQRGDGASRSGGRKSGGSGGRAGDIYALFQAPVGNPGAEVRSPVPDPKVRWVSVTDGTRTAPDLEDRAAKYLPQENLILINSDFRVFTDMVERWCKRYAHAPGGRSVVESVVREWFEQQLVEAVMGALALRGGSTLWTMQDLEQMWRDEALTAVVLPRYHIDVNVKRTLGAKLGSLKEHVA